MTADDHYSASRSPDPSPEEILERCAEIRQGWSLYEEMRRSGAGRSKLGLRLVSTAEIDLPAITDPHE